MNLDPYFMSHTEINLKWSRDLNARTETINSQKKT